MRWSFRLGSLFGVPIYVHVTFLLLLGGIAVLQGLEGGVAAGLSGATWVATIFGCVVLHEFGHILTARRFGIPTRDVTLLPIGGVARLERMPAQPRQELLVALAGPAVNVAIAAAAWLLLVVSGAALGGIAPEGGSFLGRLLAINVGLAVFNLLPAFPLDGGRVLRALLATAMGYVHATDIAATVGRGMALVFGLLGLFGNPMLILIAMFVWFGAGQEAAHVRYRASFDRAAAGERDAEAWRSAVAYTPDGRPVRVFQYRVGPLPPPRHDQVR